MSTEISTVAMLFGGHIDFEDGTQHHHSSRHNHTISDTRNTERAKFLAVRFWYPYTSHCLCPIRLPAECVRQFAEPSILSVLLDVRKALPVHSRCASIGTATPVRVPEHVLAIQLVVQKIKSIARRFLRFRLQRRL